MAQTIAGKPFDQRDVLVYVHGFNTDYDEAAFRIVQVAADGGFRGTQVLFTWPSYRRVLAYSGDREVATASRDALEKLLSDLGRTPGVGRIHILAHSMGPSSPWRRCARPPSPAMASSAGGSAR